VFEETFLFNDTVRANIAFARPEAPMVDIERAAVLAGAHDFIQRLPDGYDTILGERGYSLSGGQRQRVAIARALAPEPELVLADEPTASLDSKSGQDVVELLGNLCRNRGSAVLLVTHDLRLLKDADRIWRIEDGRVASWQPDPAQLSSH